MWLLFGTTEVDRVTGRGEFSCPNCDARRPYERRTRQAMWDVFFIPVLPLGPKIERIHCLLCQASFDAHLLRSDSAGARQGAVLRHALRRAAHRFMPSGGRDPAERRAFQAASLELTGVSLDDAAVDAELAQAAADPRPLAAHFGE